MTDSRRENILKHVESVVRTAVPAATKVYRSRVEAMRREEGSGIIIEPINDTADYNNLNTVEWLLSFRLAVITRGVKPDQLADPIINSLFSAIMTDRTLGGRVFDVIPSNISFNILEADQPAGITEVVFSARYRTSSDDLTQ